MVLRIDGPSVFLILIDPVCPHIYHGLYGKHHSGYHQHLGAGFGDVAHKRILVELQADAVPPDLADNGVAVFDCVLVDLAAHVSEKSPGNDSIQADLNAFLSDFDQPALLIGDISDAVHSGRV